ncbi:MAG: hypothetical protein NUV55_11395 [Sulfuricaulis sp.]|uniref:hypothetical protein n=1 Tax=Sulfuricaulis sp. TaxID=2003553 RepID=UPI0025E7B2CE|nr:hypothetical protein [Sulfuricaulis sp.]MCR4347788.1 hypothetical protein [Sulfuricaulis sp.]
MSWRTDPKYLKMMAFIICLFAGSGAAAGPLPSALSDLRLIPGLSGLECPKTEAEPKSADAPHEIEGLVGGASLNYTQALGNIKAALEGSVSAKAMNALDANPVAKDPVAATRLGFIAMAAEKPLATVALAVKAHETAPTEPVFLANLAGIANYYGLHREALAFAQKAEPLAKKMPAFQHAALLSNKGYALNSLGRPQEAEAALKEAIRLAPDLSEAYNNLAFSLGDQDKCPQAKRYLRASKTRRPAAVLKTTPQITEETTDSEETPERLPLGQVIDLSKGKRGVLPAVPYASDPSQVEAVAKQLNNLREQTKPLEKDFKEMAAEAKGDAIKRLMHWRAQQDTSGILTADFAEALLNALDEYTVHIMAFHQTWLGDDKHPQHPDPDMRSLTDAAAETHKRLIGTTIEQSRTWSERYKSIIKEYDREIKPCEKLTNPSSCRSLAELRKNSAICMLGKGHASQLIPFMKAYDQAVRNLYAESFYRASAVAAHFSDPALKKWSKLLLGAYTVSSLELLLMEVTPLRSVIRYCEAANYTPMDVMFAELKQMAADCEASAKAKASASVFEISANCEQIEVGVSTPGGVGLFSQVSYEFSQRFARIKDPKERFLEKQAGRDPDVKLNLPGYGDAFDGKLTVFTGVQAKASTPGGVAEVSVKAGGSTTFGGDGNIVNAGGKVEVSVSVQAGAGGASAGVEVLVSSHGGSK